jgi:Zn-dependent protease with chaperone function
MGIKSTLEKAWRIWGHWNNFKELLDLLGWKQWLRDSIISIFVYFAGGGVIGVFVGALSIGGPISVLIAALVVGVLSAALRCFVLLNRALSRIAETHAPPSAAQASGEPEPNVDARVAFFDT